MLPLLPTCVSSFIHSNVNNRSQLKMEESGPERTPFPSFLFYESEGDVDAASPLTHTKSSTRVQEEEEIDARAWPISYPPSLPPSLCISSSSSSSSWSQFLRLPSPIHRQLNAPAAQRPLQYIRPSVRLFSFFLKKENNWKKFFFKRLWILNVA